MINFLLGLFGGAIGTFAALRFYNKRLETIYTKYRLYLDAGREATKIQKLQDDVDNLKLQVAALNAQFYRDNNEHGIY